MHLIESKPRRRRLPLTFLAVLFIALCVPKMLNPAEPAHGGGPPAAAQSEENASLDTILEELKGLDQGHGGGEVARVLVSLFIILLAAKLGGEMLERIGQPAVLGELALGVIIGNLGLVGIHGFEFLKHDLVLEILAEIGVVLLLFEVGLESNLREMMSVGLSSFLVAVLGVIAPFFLGWGVAAFFWNDLLRLMEPEVQAVIGPYAVYVQIFIGAVLCATSVGITARVLKDMGKIKTRESRIVLGAAVFDDVLGLIILAVCVGVVSAVGGGEPLDLKRIESAVSITTLTEDEKDIVFTSYTLELLDERNQAGYIYNTRTDQLTPAGPVSPKLEATLTDRLPAVRSGDEIDTATVSVESFEELGLRVYLEKPTFGPGNILWIVVISIAFFVAMILAGLVLAQPLYKYASYLRVHGVLLTSALLICFLSAWVATRIGLAPIVGAFAAGLILEEVHFRELPDRKKHSLEELLAPLTTFLTPVFFVRMGITVDLSSFGNVSILGFALALTAVAIIGKQICSLGVLEEGADRISVGLGMIPRGEVGLIFANEGTKLMLGGQPVIDENILSAVVIMVMITTLVTPPVLKWKFSESKSNTTGG